MDNAVDDSVHRLIASALSEDIGPMDITTHALVDPHALGRAGIVAKESLVLAGGKVAEAVFRKLDPQCRITEVQQEGQTISEKGVIMKIEGKMAPLLQAERTALNFLQRLSGIATHTRAYVKAVGSTGVRLVDTRKTTPGWRNLEKYAVRVGGAYNHRMGLFDGVLIKENHITAAGGIRNAVSLARAKVSHLVKIEVEAGTLDEVEEALEAGADVILLDNMDTGTILEAVRIIDKKALVEVSGGVTMDRLSALCETGVDIISSGALTHSATAVDISMYVENLQV